MHNLRIVAFVLALCLGVCACESQQRILEPVPYVSVVALRHASSNEMAAIVEDFRAASRCIIDESLGYRVLPMSDPVFGTHLDRTVTADASRNAVVIRSATDDFPRIFDLVLRLDDAAQVGNLIPQMGEHAIGVVVLKHANCYRVAQEIEDRFEAARRSGEQRAGCLPLAYPSGPRRMVFVPDDTRNAVIMRGEPHEILEAIEDIRKSDTGAGLAPASSNNAAR